MALQLQALTVDALDPAALARFWCGLLGGDVRAEGDGFVLSPREYPGFEIFFTPTTEPKTVPNQMHPDLTSSSPGQQRETVERALALGATHLDVGQRPEEGHVVLADPEGNEFCVIPAGNRFLEGCGFLGALAGDGSQTTGYFWSQALGWPLVWDQDEETAIQAPTGGPKLTWGGPPLAVKAGKERWHFDLRPDDGSSREDEVHRLLGLGASRADIGQGSVEWDVLADPDGHEFCVLEPVDGAQIPPGKPS